MVVIRSLLTLAACVLHLDAAFDMGHMLQEQKYAEHQHRMPPFDVLRFLHDAIEPLSDS